MGYYSVLLWSHVRESKTVLDSGFHAVDSRFQVLDSGLFVRRTWIPDSGFRIPDSEFRIPISNGIPDSLSCIPYSTSKISDIQESGSPLHGRNINMIVNTESITVTRTGKEPIPLYASITTHGETRTRPVQAWVNREFQTN